MDSNVNSYDSAYPLLVDSGNFERSPNLLSILIRIISIRLRGSGNDMNPVRILLMRIWILIMLRIFEERDPDSIFRDKDHDPGPFYGL